MLFSSISIQYNGNISSVYWATNLNQVKSGFGYGYDELNRLTHGEYYKLTDNGYTHDGSFDEKNLTYDANGNLETLNRYSTGNSPIDLLSYTYLNGGNQIGYIVDPTLDVPGVVDYPGGTSATQGFQYDQNGNMTVSADKGLNTPILYNYLNKPEVLDFGTDEKINYIYDGAGNKLAKIVKYGDARPESSLIYSGNFVYDLNQNLRYILTGEGRLVPDNDSYRFEYFMKDHLGNTRATYAPAVPGLAQTAEYQHYYPFGMQLEALCYNSGVDLPNNYLYNGKELQLEYGLGWYDYGARFYDPQLGRWHCVDPKAEMYQLWSPYCYTLNNPIKFIDPDGTGVDGYKNLQGNYEWFNNEHSNLIYKNDNFWTKVTDNKDVFEMVKAGILNSAPLKIDKVSIGRPDVLTSFEMWLESPSYNVGEATMKVGANMIYDMVNSPFSLLSGKTLGGTELTSKEKTDAFVDVAPGLLSLGLTGTKTVIKVTEKGIGGFNNLVKAVPELTTTKGLPSGMKWQSRAGQVYQWNKINIQGLNTFNRGLKTTTVLKEIIEEKEKE